MAQQAFQILPGEKFAVVALNGASRASFASPLQLGPRVWALTSAPIGVGHWREWIGSLAADRVETANLWLIAKQASLNPGVLDQENEDLWDEVLFLFFSILLIGTPFYETAYRLTGAHVPGKNPRIRRYQGLHHYLVSFGAQPMIIDVVGMQRAAALSPRLMAIHSANNHIRLRRGFKVFIDALRLEGPAERVHQFVRSIEGIIKPGRHNIKQTMMHRARTLLVGGKGAEDVMGRLYDLRSKEEHLADWKEALRYVPRTKRDDILVRSVRQAEAVARNSYRRLLEDAQAFGQFSDAQIDAFWTLSERDRIRFWRRNERTRILEIV